MANTLQGNRERDQHVAVYVTLTKSNPANHEDNVHLGYVLTPKTQSLHFLDQAHVWLHLCRNKNMENFGQAQHGIAQYAPPIIFQY
jgi:hypothetical protein